MKEKLEELVNQNITTYQIAELIGYSQSHTCRLLQKYGLKNIYEKPRKCEECGETDPSLFEKKRKKLCCKCKNKQRLLYRQNKRKQIVSYLGGECRCCSFDKYPCSLDVHHLDATKKDPDFKCVNHWSWERVKKELKGCILVCSNCHRAIHNNYIKFENKS